MIEGWRDIDPPWGPNTGLHASGEGMSVLSQDEVLVRGAEPALTMVV